MTKRRLRLLIKHCVKDRLRESQTNGCRPVYVRVVLRRFRRFGADWKDVVLSFRRARDEIEFPTRRMRDDSVRLRRGNRLIRLPYRFQPLKAVKVIDLDDPDDKVRWLEDMEDLEGYSVAFRVKQNERVRKAQSVGLITSQEERQLLLPE